MIGRKLRILMAKAHPGETASALRARYPEDRHHLESTLVSFISTLLASIDLTHPEIISLDISLAHSEPLDQVRLVHRSAPLTLGDRAMETTGAREGTLVLLWLRESSSRSAKSTPLTEGCVLQKRQSCGILEQ